MSTNRHSTSEAPDGAHDLPAAASTVNTSRRRLFRGLSGGVGVLLAVPARTALGSAQCQSISAAMSGATSPRPGNGTVCSGGRSPGYWVQPQHFPNWLNDAKATPPTFNPAIEECAQGQGSSGAVLNNIVPNTGTLLSHMGLDYPSGIPRGKYESAWAVIAEPNTFSPYLPPSLGGNPGQVLRHLVCAWLNSRAFNTAGSNYFMTEGQVSEAWAQLVATGMYCPSSFGPGTCPGGGWSADQVKQFIEDRYDINSSAPNYCSKKK